MHRHRKVARTQTMKVRSHLLYGRPNVIVYLSPLDASVCLCLCVCVRVCVMYVSICSCMLRAVNQVIMFLIICSLNVLLVLIAPWTSSLFLENLVLHVHKATLPLKVAEFSYESWQVVTNFGELFLSTTLLQLMQSLWCELGELGLTWRSSAKLSTTWLKFDMDNIV